MANPASRGLPPGLRAAQPAIVAVLNVRKGWIGGLTLQDALQQARPGDEIVMEPGTVYASEIVGADLPN